MLSPATALIITLTFLLAAGSVKGAGPDGPPEASAAYFFLSSDQIRALRPSSPARQFVARWEQRTEIIEGSESTPGNSNGWLRIAPDYVAFEDQSNHTLLLDFFLRRQFVFGRGETTFSNDDLISFVDFSDMEAIHRARLRKAMDAIGQGNKYPGYRQLLFESSLRVRTEGIPRIELTAENSGDRITFRMKDEEVAAVTFSATTITQEQGMRLETALRRLFRIHPAVIDGITPLTRLPSEISFVHEHHVSSKARSTLQLESIGTKEAPYPLPAGMQATLLSNADARGDPAMQELFRRVPEIAIAAISGNYAKPRPSFDSYLADAAQALSAGNRFAAGLALIAASTHHPARTAECSGLVAPASCASFKDMMKEAREDSRFANLVKASEQCARQEWMASARTAAGIDASAEKHGYVVSMMLFCSLANIPPKDAKDIAGLGERHPARAVSNALRAIEGNPYIPDYYYEVGRKFAVNFDPITAWRFFEFGRALGGGERGDPFDRIVAARERQLLSRHPGLF